MVNDKFEQSENLRLQIQRFMWLQQNSTIVLQKAHKEESETTSRWITIVYLNSNLYVSSVKWGVFTVLTRAGQGGRLEKPMKLSSL